MTDEAARIGLLEAAQMIDKHEQSIQSLMRTIEIQADQIAELRHRLDVVQAWIDMDDLK